MDLFMKIREFTIDMSRIHPYEPAERFEEKLFGELEKRSLLEDSFLYTVVDGERANKLKQNGTYTEEDIIYAFKRDQLRWDSDNTVDQTLKRYAREYDAPAIAIWQGDLFVEDSPLAYKFINPDRKAEALKGIAKLKMVTQNT